MQLVYKGGQISDVQIENAVLNDKLTHAEKMEFFACDFPNPVVWQNITWLENGTLNQDGTPKTTLQLTVQSMVTEGLITQERADEILA